MKQSNITGKSMPIQRLKNLVLLLETNPEILKKIQACSIIFKDGTKSNYFKNIFLAKTEQETKDILINQNVDLLITDSNNENFIQTLLIIYKGIIIVINNDINHLIAAMRMGVDDCLLTDHVHTQALEKRILFAIARRESKTLIEKIKGNINKLDEKVTEQKVKTVDLPQAIQANTEAIQANTQEIQAMKSNVSKEKELANNIQEKAKVVAKELQETAKIVAEALEKKNK